MRSWLLAALLFFNVPAISALGQTNPTEQKVTLFSVLKYRDWSRSCFSFERGERGCELEHGRDADNFDLVYGNVRLGKELDWFNVCFKTNQRSQIADLGKKEWKDIRKTPSLPLFRPQPLNPNTSLPCNIYGRVAPNGQFATVKPGHIYFIKVKSKRQDFYVMFRVEAVVPGDNITFYWKKVPPPLEEIEH